MPCILVRISHQISLVVFLLITQPPNASNLYYRLILKFPRPPIKVSNWKLCMLSDSARMLDISIISININFSSPEKFENLLIDPAIIDIGLAYNKKPAQVLLRHLTQQGIAVIPKSTNPERICENFQVRRCSLPFIYHRRQENRHLYLYFTNATKDRGKEDLLKSVYIYAYIN